MLLHIAHETVGNGPDRMPFCRMRHDSGLFIDDQHVLIFIDGVDRNILRQKGTSLLRQFRLNDISFDHIGEETHFGAVAHDPAFRLQPAQQPGGKSHSPLQNLFYRHLAVLRRNSIGEAAAVRNCGLPLVRLFPDDIRQLPLQISF